MNLQGLAPRPLSKRVPSADWLALPFFDQAERVGVEPTRPCGSPVFKTGTIADWFAFPQGGAEIFGDHAPSCPGRIRTYNPLLNREPHHRCATRQSRASGGTRTHTVRLTRAVPGLSSSAGNVVLSLRERRTGWPVGVEPTQPRFTAGPRYHFGFGHSIPGRSRTCITSAFAGRRASATLQG